MLTDPAFAPAGAQVAIGSTLTFDLPLSWATDFKAGTQKGVAITSSTAADDSIYVGPDENPASGTLTITH